MDKKAKKEYIITGVLAVFLIFILASSFKQIKQKKKDIKKTSDKKTAAIAIPKIKKKPYGAKEKAMDLSWKMEEEAKVLKAKRDPFAVSNELAKDEMLPSDLSLYGIIWDKENPVAIINEEIAAKGDKIGQYTVKEVSRDAVVLSDGSKDYKLDLNINN